MFSWLTQNTAQGLLYFFRAYLGWALISMSQILKYLFIAILGLTGTSKVLMSLIRLGNYVVFTLTKLKRKFIQS